MLWHFGPFRLDLAQAELWHAEQPVPLRPKTLALLAYLVAHAGQLVTKEALLDAVWSETAVGDGVLKTSMGELRKALGETAKAPRYIATVSRRGYRFLAPVTEYTEAPLGAIEPASLRALQPPTEEPLVAPAVLPPDTQATPVSPSEALHPAVLPPHEAERRYLTVLFCDLVNSTGLAGRMDPEDYREVVRAFHQTCTEVMQRFDGYVAQYLGDGMLVYFGYPLAHEDDAQRAVWTGLGMLNVLDALHTQLTLPAGERLAIRLGVHTGLVVVGDVGTGVHPEPLALGEVPNIAARLQQLAAPNTLVISAATYHLIEGYFTCEALEVQPLRGLVQPLQVYRVLRPSGVQSRLEVAAARGLTPLVGREPEVGLLVERWARVIAGMGQVCKPFPQTTERLQGDRQQ